MSENTNKKGIIAWDKKIPVIIPFFLSALALYALAHGGYFGHLGEEYTHLLHSSEVHYILMLSGLWFFFLRLGAEIEISDVLEAGPLVIAATIGGVVVPMLFTTGLVYGIGGTATFAIALYASAGSMATDVPMALGSARAVEKSVVTAMTMALMILAVGDDLIGVISMTGMFAEGFDQFDALAIEAVILLIAWALGKRGDIAVKEMDGDEVVNRKIFDFTFESPVLWVSMAVLNTYFLGRNGIEPILGGCLPMIFAPSAVKHMIAEKTEALALWLLFPFALVAGAVDVLSPEAWGIFTLLALFGGFFGKVLGIFFGGLIGRRYADYEGEYGINNFTTQSLIAMAVAGACNGTVAIIFVSVAEAKGLIPHAMAGQMKIGFLLTVPASYCTNMLLGAAWKSMPKNSFFAAR